MTGLDGETLLICLITRNTAKRKGELFMTDPRALLDYFEQQLDEVTQEREKLDERESALRQTVEGLRRIARLNGHTAPQPEGPAVVIAPNQFRGLSIKDAAVAYLRLANAPQTNRQVVEAIQRGGITSTARNFTKMVRNILLRDLESDSPVLSWNAPHWSLREWEVLPLQPV